MGWHTRRLPGGGVLMGVGKLAQEGKVYRGVGSLPYCLGYLFFFLLFIIRVESSGLYYLTI